MPRYRWDEPPLKNAEWPQLLTPFSAKLTWMMQRGYIPHYFQLLFHTMRTGDVLTRFRNLVAGRRGGKTLCAAWETVFYMTHPEQFHMDVHGKVDDRPLWGWILSDSVKVGRAALFAMRQVCREAGLEYGKDYTENKSEQMFYFFHGDGRESVLEYRTVGDNPEALVGAGLDLLWIDEAAKIKSQTAWDITRPSLSDKLGICYCTTTPVGKNWYYDVFFGPMALIDVNMGSVEYRSIDNLPGFHESEWRYIQKTTHPLMFRREWMASFDSMAGVELDGEWLQYYTLKDLEDRRVKRGNFYDLQIYIGVDPALSMSERADKFSLSVIGVEKDNSQAYLIEQINLQIPFPEQISLIEQYHLKWRPIIIGVENVAFQNAIVQQLERLASFPPVIGIPAKGKKSERILSMAPLFKIGRVKILESHKDFINAWLNYDPNISNPRDDELDSVEIAIRAAGIILPEMLPASIMEEDSRWAPTTSGEVLRRVNSPASNSRVYFDDHLGEDF